MSETMRARIQQAIDDIMGNESLLEMLETEAAAEMLNWGTAMAKSMVERTRDLEDVSAELMLIPRLKALRQTIRSVGNWAAGKYADPVDRVRLREKLLENFRVIFGEDAHLPSADDLDEVLNRAEDPSVTPHQHISELRSRLTPLMDGGSHA